MKPVARGVPVWLCRFRRSGGYSSRYVAAKTSEIAKRLCLTRGLGVPWSISYAGYSSPRPERALPRGKAKKVKLASSRRAEVALTIYALLRVDWPIGSILACCEAERRWQVSDRTLRDFIANMGATIQRLEADGTILDQVVEAQGLAWWHAAQERNLRSNSRVAARHADRKELFRYRARRLRQRRAYAIAVGELTAALNGHLPIDERAAEHFHEHLLEQGFAVDEADSLTRRYTRVAVPRL